MWPLYDVPDAIRSLLIQNSLLSMGKSKPNPAVGCVIETDSGQLIAGATEEAGKRHAEIVALDACPGNEKFKLFVTLEPCSSYGRTPPCLLRLQSDPRLKSLIFYRRDPSQSQSLEVLQEQIPIFQASEKSGEGPDFFISGFLKRITRRRPRLFFKVAVTADGFMADRSPERLFISGPQGRAFTQLLRSRMCAVLTGPGATAMDWPRLGYRASEVAGKADFLIPASSDHVFIQALRQNMERICAEPEAQIQPRRLPGLGRPFKGWREYAEKQSQDPLVTFLQYNPELELPAGARSIELQFSCQSILHVLDELKCNDVLIEGGAATLQLFENDLEPEDLLMILQSKKLKIGQGLKAPAFLFAHRELGRFHLGDDELILCSPS